MEVRLRPLTRAHQATLVRDHLYYEAQPVGLATTKKAEQIARTRVETPVDTRISR